MPMMDMYVPTVLGAATSYYVLLLGGFGQGRNEIMRVRVLSIARIDWELIQI